MKLMRHFLLRRVCAAFVFSITIMTGCSDRVDEPVISYIDQNAESVSLKVDFNKLAGDITAEELSALLQSNEMLVSGYYYPTKLELGKTAKYVYSEMGRHIGPIVKTHNLPRHDIVFLNNSLQFEFPASLPENSTYRLVEIYIDIPTKEKIPTYTNSNINLEIRLANTSSSENHFPQTEFCEQSALFHVAGKVEIKGVGLYSMVRHKQSHWCKAVAGAQSFTFHPVHRYAGYQMALERYQPDIHSNASGVAMNENMEITKEFSGMKLDRHRKTRATVDGHLLELVEIRGKNNESDRLCGEDFSVEYRLFFVDCRLVSYQEQSRGRSCLAPPKDGSTTDDRFTLGARWDDMGKLVYYVGDGVEMLAESDKPISISAAMKRNVLEMRQFGETIRTAFH